MSLMKLSKDKADKKKVQGPPSLSQLKADAKAVVSEVKKMDTSVPMTRELSLMQKKLASRGIIKSKRKKIAQSLLGGVASGASAQAYKAFEGMFNQEEINKAVKNMPIKSKQFSKQIRESN